MVAWTYFFMGLTQSRDSALFIGKSIRGSERGDDVMVRYLAVSRVGMGPVQPGQQHGVPAQG